MPSWRVCVMEWSRAYMAGEWQTAICFDYGVYYSPVSTPRWFSFSCACRVGAGIEKSRNTTVGTIPFLYPFLSPQEYLSRAYNDAPKYCAIIESTRLEKDEVIFKGEIPARCIGEYRNDLNFYTNGRSVCITELKRVSGNFRRACVSATPPEQPFRQDPAYVSEDNVTSCAMQAFIAGYSEISLIKSASERRNHLNQKQTDITTGKQIRHLRTQSGMTQEELAGKLNVTRQGAIELGERC